ncbi:MAG: hypothetical protein ACRDTV_15245, partial [Mycobacterium sp.]
AVVVDPMTWAALRRLKVGGSNTNESLLGAGTVDATPMLLSLPVLRSRFIPANSGLVVDKTAIAAAVGPVRVAQSEHARFDEDAVVLRATWRIVLEPGAARQGWPLHGRRGRQLAPQAEGGGAGLQPWSLDRHRPPSPAGVVRHIKQRFISCPAGRAPPGQGLPARPRHLLGTGRAGRPPTSTPLTAKARP